MEYLARAIVDCVHLLRELLAVWMNGHGNVPGNITGNVPAQGEIGDNIASIFANTVSFLTELAAEITRQMGNIVS